MFPLPSAWTLEAGLSSEAGIPELWDTSVPVISGTYIDAVCSSLPHHGPGETVAVAGRCTRPYHFTVRLDGPGQGSRSRPGLTSRDFRDLGACLRHYTCRLRLQISRLFRVCFYSRAYGQEYCLILVHLIPLLLHYV